LFSTAPTRGQKRSADDGGFRLTYIGRMPSLAIKSYAYDETRNELTVTFATGRGYVYALVPPEVFAAFEAASSKGAFLNRHIRDRFPFRKAKAATETPALSLRETLVGSSRR
jgi:hypothetical protein